MYASRRIRYEYSSPGSIYRTTDGGGSWSDITANLPTMVYFTSLDVSQVNADVAYVSLAGLTAGEKVFVTTDGGISWTNISYNLPNVPVNCIKTIPVSGELIVGSDFGVYMYDAVNNLWIDQSLGLPNVIVSDIDFNPALNKIYVATFGRGIWESNLSALVGVLSHSNAEVSIELFPSLNSGDFTIRFTDKSFMNEKVGLSIIDVTGRQVYSGTLAGGDAYGISSGLKPGMYFARLSGKGLGAVKSFVVQ